jgi:TrmH family RNA methyltransferase
VVEEGAQRLSRNPLTVGNTRVKEARKLSRRSVRAERRLFLADGPKAVEGALSTRLDSGASCVVEVFATPAAAEEYAGLAGAGPDWTLVDDRALASLSDSVTPAGLVALCRFVDVNLEQALEGSRLVAICADVRDPGNAGTVIRTADAAGADAVVLAGTSVDAYNPKTVRATVGSLFHLPLAVADNAYDAVSAARAAGLTVLAADGDGELDLFEADHLLAGPTAWLFGNEARGLPTELAAVADHRVRIPIHGRAESLNLSTAAAICLYAAARVQRG